MSQAACSSTIPAVFQFNTQPVRIVMRDDDPWFVATDIAKVLEYRSGADVSRMCDDDERGGTQNVRTPSRTSTGAVEPTTKR